jgi:CRISPR-associated endoribonuclease Cas6
MPTQIIVMRLNIKISLNTEPIPFNYQQYLTGAIHKWLGHNKEHGRLSLYSFSWLKHLVKNDDGFDLTPHSYFFFSAYSNALISRLISGITRNPDLCFGSRITDIEIFPDRRFSTRERFLLASPVLIKRTLEDTTQHYTWDQPESDLLLTETIQRKLSAAGLNPDGIKISFDRSFGKSKTKISAYRDIKNRVNICPVIIEGTPAQLAFAWNVGIGNSTGIGYGALS